MGGEGRVDATNGDEIDVNSWAGGRGQAIDHFRRHGQDFGAGTVQEYVRRAVEFYWRADRSRLPAKIDPLDGTIRIYERRTNTFGAYTSDGRPITFHRPATGVRYWTRQPGVSKRGP